MVNREEEKLYGGVFFCTSLGEVGLFGYLCTD